MISGILIGMFIAGIGTVIASATGPVRLGSGMCIPQKWALHIGS